MKYKAITSATLLAVTVALTGCQQMNQTQEYTLGGAALGAGAGALIGAGSGHAGTGAAIGAAAGAVGGALMSDD
ncbi:MAG TPA: YMGG-like glycine zipper-containing protein [Gammaproteobacteria bacterium]|nr:YMGG-like glycine zipper-containing protein [Gammaproteobacteria bacterium]